MHRKILGVQADAEDILDKQGRETAIGQWIDEKTHSCYVCDHFKANYNRYLDTFFDLYKKDEEFARLFREEKASVCRILRIW